MKRTLSILLCSLLLLSLLSSCSRPAIAPMIADDYLSLGEKFLLELDYEQALVQFLGVIEIDPMNPRGYSGAAEAYAGMELYDRAMGILQQGLEELSGSQGFLRDAAEIYEGIIDKDPINPDAYIGLAEIYIMLGENENAYEILMIGAERLPDNADIAQMLSELEEFIKPEPTGGSGAPSDGSDTAPTDESDAAPTDDNDAAPGDGEVSPDGSNTPPDVSEMYLAYYNTVLSGSRLEYLFLGLEYIDTDLTGGGLLDFDNDGLPELALIYEGTTYRRIGVVYTYKDGQVFELFNEVLSDGGNYRNNYIVERDGIGSMCYFLRAVSFGGIFSYRVLEDGELVEKLSYQQYHEAADGSLFSSDPANPFDYQIWEISRNGVVVDSGTTEPLATIPQIEAIKAEVESVYGTEWVPLAVDDLVKLLANNAHEDSASSEPSTALNSTVGNTAGNLSNGGLVCEYGDYVYFIHDASIYRTKNGSETPEHIFSYADEQENLSALNIIDGRIYFSLMYLDEQYNYQGSVYSMNLNGGDAVKLAEDCHSITVTENYILGQDGSRNLLRMDHEGGHKIIVKDSSSLYSRYSGLKYSYYNGWLYYVTSDGIVARMNAETLDEERVSAIGVTIGMLIGMNFDSYLTSITCGYSGFYFGEFLGGDITNAGIQRISFTSGQIELVFGRNAYGSNEQDGWIYFAKFVEGGYNGGDLYTIYKLARISVDGANIQDLCDDDPSRVFVTRDWVYYELHNKNYNATRSLYRVPLGGGAPEFVM